MSRRIVSCLALSAATLLASPMLFVPEPAAADAVAGRHLVLPPPAADGRAQALLVVVPGAQLAPEAYVDLAEKIQRESGLALWIAVLRMTANLPNPVEAKLGFDAVVSGVSEAAGIRFAKEKIFVAGHSMGGIIARRLARDEYVGGLVLFGSYLPKSQVTGMDRIADYPLPVLTLGGELDGQTRLPWLAREYADLAALRQSAGESALVHKPVVVLPEVNHYHFAKGGDDSRDLPSPRTLESAHAAIAAVTTAFLEVNATWAGLSSERIAEQTRLLSAEVARTEALTRPLRSAWDLDVGLCERAQRTVAPVPVDVRVTMHDGPLSIIQAKPSLNGSLALEAHSYIPRRNNPMDISNTEHAPATVWCKMKSREAIAAAAGISTSVDPVSCADLNRRTLAVARGLLGDAQALRYEEANRALVIGDDIDKGTGIAWVTGEADTEVSPDGMEFHSPALRTKNEGAERFAGMHYCKLLPVSRAVEWMLVDSLRR